MKVIKHCKVSDVGKEWILNFFHLSFGKQSISQTFSNVSSDLPPLVLKSKVRLKIAKKRIDITSHSIDALGVTFAAWL